MAIQIRIMGHKKRDHSELTKRYKELGFEVKEYIDQSNDYTLENNMAERHKGAQVNLVKMVIDPDLPKDNNGFVIMPEDDVIPCDTLYEALDHFVKTAPCDRCYSGFHMRQIERERRTNQTEHINLVEHNHVESLCDNKWLHKNGVPRISVWFEKNYDFTKIDWQNAVRRYNKTERRVW